jgi:ABC-type lipoprotein export system ATPase subunit
VTPRVVEIAGVSKQYGALRPLRVERLTVAAGERLSLVGLDQPAAEVFINLLTGASLPDTGRVRVFERATTEIADSESWIAALDRFGIVSERAALLDAFSIVQNLAMPFSLDVEPPTVDVLERATRLAREVGLAEQLLNAKAGEIDASARLLTRLARALAHDPSLVLLEHPTASIAAWDVPRIARQMRGIVERRSVAAIAITMDTAFAGAFGRTLTLDGATGRTNEAKFGKIKLWT